MKSKRWGRILGMALALCMVFSAYPAQALADGLIGGSVGEITQFYANGLGTHVVTASALRVRSGPGTGYSQIGTLYKGNTVQVISISNDFCRIQASDGSYGYVMRDYLTAVSTSVTAQPTSAPTSAPTTAPTASGTKLVYRVTASALNVRSGAGTAYSKVTTLLSGEYVYKLADVNSSWMKIQLTDGRVCYAMSTYLKYSYTTGGTTTSPTATTSPTITPQITAKPTSAPTSDLTGLGPGDIYITTGNVNLRSGPYTSATVKKVVMLNSYVTLLSKYSDQWYYVRTQDDVYGYMSKTYMKYTFTVTSTATPTPAPTSTVPVVDDSKQIYSFSEMKEDMNELSKRYPTMVTIVAVGNTMWGDQIPAVCIGNRSASKALLIDGGIHGREYMSSLLIMEQMEYILNNQAMTYNGRTYSSLLNECCIWFIPMINPDGIYISQNGVSGMTNQTRKNNLLAMNGGSTYFTRWKANGYGVDLNRNFSEGWVYQGTPSGSEYSGSYANSESETQAMVTFVKNHTNVKASINYHTTGNCIYWHYGQSGAAKTRDKAIADKLKSITGYYLRDENYSGKGGGFMDWMVGTCKLPSFTLELGNGSLDAPQAISQFAAIWNANKSVPMFMVSYIVDNL